MGTTISSESITWLDNLPTEIIFLIFDYLSSNDIIYTFFNYNERFNNLLLQNQHYFNHFELPQKNFEKWKNILSIISSQIKYLYINTIDLSFPLNYFSNLKSIIISLPFHLSYKQLQNIFENIQFNNLYSFKIKTSQYLSNQLYTYHTNQSNYILENIFNQNNSLKIFQYSFIISSSLLRDLNNFEKNFYLNSLTLILTNFEDIFCLILYTPNLKYLNIQSHPPYNFHIPINNVKIKLKKFILKLNNNEQREILSFNNTINFNQLINGIKQFSLSLNYLSLNLIDIPITSDNQFPFNNLKLQQLLESMIELKQFHLYAKLYNNNQINNDSILSKFNNQFWFDHNWIFGMHENYFYTLPFHFDYLYNFSQDYNNSKILENNYQIWYNVKSIHIKNGSKYDYNFLKELKIKMPKLTFIEFDSSYYCYKNRTKDKYMKQMNITLDNVTTIKYTGECLANIKEWLIYTLPNVKHLILSSTSLLSLDNRFTEILDKKIQRLDIDDIDQLEQLTQIDYNYFSNLKYINFCLNIDVMESELCAFNVTKILKKYKNLKTLLIYIGKINSSILASHRNIQFKEFPKHLNTKEIMKNYQITFFPEYMLLSKEECGNDNIQDGIVSSTLKKFPFFHQKT